jgi:hypothetical protein
MSTPCDFIPIANRGDDIKREPVPAKVSQQTPANRIDHLLYVINRSEGDIVEPGARQ